MPAPSSESNVPVSPTWPDLLPSMTSATTEYQQWLDELERTRRDWLLLDRRWNLIRSGLFLAAVALLIFGYWLTPNSVMTWLGWLAMVGFLVAVTWHENLRERLHAQRMRRNVLRRLIARAERRWDRLPLWNPQIGSVSDPTDPATADAGTAPASGPRGGAVTKVDRGGSRNAIGAAGVDPGAVADDLDVFGHGSLFQLVSMASLGPGLRTLAEWLIGPAAQATATRRYQAAAALAKLRHWRVEFYTHARRAGSGTADPDHFLHWINSPSWLRQHSGLALWSVLGPLVLVGLFIALVVLVVMGRGAEPETLQTIDSAIRWVAGGIAAVVGINLLISTFLLGDVHEIFAAALSGRGDVDGYRQMFELCEALPDTVSQAGEADLVAHAKRTLCDPVTGASVAIRSLGRVATAAALKRSGGLFLVYLLLQMGGLWDLHVLRYLERWQQAHVDDAARWFEALGELEAAASLAALIDENPTWAAPHWISPTTAPGAASAATPVATVLAARQLGHPLLRDQQRVCNDVSVGPQGTLLLVTGSNMSGKSTLLRSIGLNVLLAGAGGPVCAEAFSLPDLELATSIRVRDNLAEGVSFYMAELKSLARVVRHAEALSKRRGASGTQPTGTLLYLLDEILQGTNSRERQIAVAHVLRHLIDHGAIGAISTHDLELAEDPSLREISQTVHFRETITKDEQGRDEMTFDYRMRQGVSPTTNALRLLEVVGLGIPNV